VDTETAAAFRDGVLTKRNTFQKYFDQPELPLNCAPAPRRTSEIAGYRCSITVD
jgi:hypothetical protein